MQDLCPKVSSMPYDAVRSRTHRNGRQALTLFDGLTDARSSFLRRLLEASGPKVLTRGPASRPSVLGSSPTGPGRCPSREGKSTYQVLNPRTENNPARKDSPLGGSAKCQRTTSRKRARGERRRPSPAGASPSRCPDPKPKRALRVVGGLRTCGAEPIGL